MGGPKTAKNVGHHLCTFPNLAMLFYFQLLFHKSFGIQRQNLAVEKLAQGLAKLLLLRIMSPRETFLAVSMKT